MSKALRKYLQGYAEPEIRFALDCPGSFANVVAIPACDEDSSLVRGHAPCAAVGALCVLVLNARDDHGPGVHQSNHRTRQALLEQGNFRRISDSPPAFFGTLGAVSYLLIDRASEGHRLPSGQGVGLARKIGCDVALALRAQGRVGSAWIHWSDGDVELPVDYFQVPEPEALGAVALSYPFVHVPSGCSAIDEAHRAYDAFLRYYVAGMRFAGSPYAMQTIGSTIAVDAETYAQVRGVPRRQAAEDFYLLNKACKLGRVVEPETGPIRIRARRSERVPFGTGRATGDIVDELDSAEAYTVTDPRLFEALKVWLGALEAVASTRQVSALDERLARQDRAQAEWIEEALGRLGARGELARAVADPSARDLRRRLREWFDGLRTLRFMHELRDAGAPDIPWRQALSNAPFPTPPAPAHD